MPSVWIIPKRNKHGRNYMLRWSMEIRDPATGKVMKRIMNSESCGPSKAYAEKRKTEVREELYSGKTFIRKKSFGLDLFTMLDRYLDQRRGTGAPNTYAQWVKPAVDAFKKWRGNTPVAMIEQKDFVDWRNRLTDGGLAPATVSARLRDVMIAFAWAVDQDLLDRHPVRKRKSIMPRVDPSGRYITPEDLEHLLPELPEVPRRACYLLLHHGLRKGELLALDWKHVYTQSTPWEMEVLAGKTGWARTVTVHPNVATMLGIPKPSGAVIAGLTANVLENHVPDALRRLKARGLDLGRIRLHDFRHTAATNFMWRHGDVFRLLREFGWRSLAAAKVYQHFTRRGNVPEYPDFAHYLRTNEAGTKEDHGKG